MGEYSKRIGEIGEEIVINFLEIIGWNDVQRNFDIPSIDPEKHKKNTHGIDGYFSYRSPMIVNTLENVLISCKYSNSTYPNSPSSKFKEHYNDLGIAIESFKKSELRASTNNTYNRIESVFDRGVLFWINSDSKSQEDLFYKLSRVELPDNITHDGIILIDNKRMEFIYDSLTYIKLNYTNDDIQFVYFQTGFNNDDTSARSGKILPIQLINSSIIPIKVQNSKTGDITFVLSTLENFEKEELIKLMGLAKNISSSFQSKTIIAFPDYSELQHSQIVNNAKQIFEDASYTRNLSVVNFNSSFRNL